MEFICPNCKNPVGVLETWVAHITGRVTGFDGTTTEVDWEAEDAVPQHTLHFECDNCGHKESELEAFKSDDNR